MMTLLGATLRRHLLLVLGGCAAGCSRQTAPQEASAVRCGQDQVKEVVCGTVSEQSPPVCGATGDRLTAFGASRLSVTGEAGRARDGRFASFSFDAQATEAFRKTSGPPPPLPQYCCYSSCTPVEVAATASAELPAGKISGERCIDAPEGGTSRPGPVASCPAAVKLDGVLRPFARAAPGRCCYFSPREPEPPQPQHPRGRPLVMAGGERVAGLVASAHWG